MIEVCFDDGLSALLKIVSNQVFSFPLFLDVGDLRHGVFSPERKRTAANLFENPWLSEHSYINDSYWNNISTRLDQLCKLADSGEAIRIWYAHDADSFSSFMWLTSFLSDYDADISSICLEDLEFGLEPYCFNWCRVELEQIPSFLNVEKIITKPMQKNIALRWERICKSPLSLRIVLNGAILPVQEDFYDNMILDNLPDDPFVPDIAMRNILRNVLTDTPYFFIFRRMCDLFKEHCDIVDEHNNPQVEKFRNLVFQKKK